jgi:hypothetical protein
VFEVDADRKGTFHAMRSTMLKRTGIEDLLSRIKVPTATESCN